VGFLPQLYTAQQFRAALGRERPYNRIRPTVGDDFDGWRPRPLFEQTRQQIGRILGSAWYDDSTLPGELVIGEVEERRSMSATEVLRVVRGIQRAHWHDESETVGGSHVTTAPRSSESDQTLRCNQPGIGASDGFGPHVVLLDPEQPPTGKCRYITAREGLEVDVARFGDQHGAQTDRQIGNSGGAFADVGELVTESCAGVDFE